MKKGPLLASILIGVAFIGGAVIFAGGKSGSPVIANNVSMEGETQVVEIAAKGGYTPKLTSAKAGIPTMLRVKTNGTYDCSSTIRIPSMNYSKTLEPTGVTDITVPPQKAGTTLEGLCSMGMYNFSVKFL